MRSPSPPRPSCRRPGSAGADCCSAVRRSAAPRCSAVASAAADAPTTSGASATSTTLTLQSSLSDPKPKAALEAVMKDFTGPKTTLNTVAIEQFRAQLPTYLISANPPDVLTWYAGSVARDYASKGLLLDLSDMWTGDGACAKFSAALKSLSSGRRRQADLRPDQLLLVERLLPEVAFDEWGVNDPHDLGRSSCRCATRSRARGSTPLTMRHRVHALGGLGLVRLPRPADQRRRVPPRPARRKVTPSTAPRCSKVMDTYAALLPYFDPKGRSYSLAGGRDADGAEEGRHVPDRRLHHPARPGGPRSTTWTSSRVPAIDPAIPSRRGSADRRLLREREEQERGRRQGTAVLSWPARLSSRSTSRASRLVEPADLARRRHRNFSPLVQKGVKLLQETKDITQFFNRDSSDALQTTADAALNKFLDKPKDVDSILKDWQAAASKVFKS